MRARGTCGVTKDPPEGGTVQGTSGPRRIWAWRPRRMRSALRVRAYSATAPRMWSRRCSGGSHDASGAPRTSTGTALLGPFLPEQPLMDSGAGESIRCRDEDPFEGPHGRPVTSLISAPVGGAWLPCSHHRGRYAPRPDASRMAWLTRSRRRENWCAIVCCCGCRLVETRA